ncbi:MAG: SIS domain-containing protein, partial [Acidobacteriales bacterium]|nr:SIS domain-containing protein [Terriglobales bacterium]
MLEDLAVIEGEYLRDILHQPQALENTLAGLEPSKPLQDLAARLNKGRFHRVVLTGMGASFHALHPLNLELISHGFTALMVETSELVHYKSQFFDPKTLIVAVSQSGQSAEMVRLVQTNHQRSAVIAITNTPGSPLARHADAAAITQAGNEFSVSCKTYVTALMALKWLGDVLCERDLRRTRQELKHACPAVAAYLADWKACVRTLAELLKDIRHLFLVGRGASLATVGTGALIVKESDHFHAEGMSSAAFRHGPFEMLSKETFVLVFAGDTKTRDLNQRLLSDILQEEGRAELVDRD